MTSSYAFDSGRQQDLMKLMPNVHEADMPIETVPRPETPGVSMISVSSHNSSSLDRLDASRLDASQCTDAHIDVEGYEPDSMMVYLNVLTSDIMELAVGSERQRFRIHRSVIIPAVPYLADMFVHSANPDVIELPYESPLPVAAVLEYLYVGDRWTPPYSNPFVDKVDLKTKIALAEVFILAEKWNISYVCRSCVDALASVPLPIPDQFQYWQFIYDKTAPGSVIRIPSQRYVSARKFVRGLEQENLLADLAGGNQDIVFDLLMLSIHESG